MEENNKKEKKNKIIGISLGIVVVLCFVAIGTYAYWTLTRKQTDTNTVIASCIDFELVDAVTGETGISLESAWPMSDSDALNELEGYSFNVVNNCPQAVNYVIALETFNSTNGKALLGDSVVSLALDNEVLGTFNTLSDIDKISGNAIKAKALRTANVAGNGSNTHNLKLWINSSSTVEDQSKTFLSKIFITGGQGIENNNPALATLDKCFTMTGTKITGYDFDDPDCGKNVVIPATVNGIAVEGIGKDAFKTDMVDTDADFVMYFNLSTETFKTIIFDKSNEVLVKGFMNYQLSYFPSGTVDYITYEQLKQIDLTDYDFIPVKIYGVRFRSRDSEGVDYTAETAKLYMFSSEQKGVDSDSNPIFDFKVYIKDKTYEQLIKKYLKEYVISQGDFSSESTISFISESDLDSMPDDPEYIGIDFDEDEASYEEKRLVGITGLDLGSAFNLDYIESFAFSNCEAEQDGCGSYSDAINVTKSLNSLTFGNNDKNINAGLGAFAGVQVDNLEIYTSLKTTPTDTPEYLSVFGGSIINNLTVKPTKDNTVFEAYNYYSNIDLSIFNSANVKNINIASGITELGSAAFDGLVANVDSVTLPNTLKKIGDYAITGKNKVMPSITIPASVEEIGKEAFAFLNNTITIKRANSDGMILGEDWSGNATVVYDPS